MKEVEFFRWWLPPDAWHKKRHLSGWKMSREYADKTYPGAEPDLSTREVRMVSDPLPSSQEPLVRRHKPT